MSHLEASLPDGESVDKIPLASEALFAYIISSSGLAESLRAIRLSDLRAQRGIGKVHQSIKHGAFCVVILPSETTQV